MPHRPYFISQKLAKSVEDLGKSPAEQTTEQLLQHHEKSKLIKRISELESENQALRDSVFGTEESLRHL